MSFVKFASQENHDENSNERFDLDPTANINILLPTQTFLTAAVSLKDKVCLPLSLCMYLLRLFCLFNLAELIVFGEVQVVEMTWRSGGGGVIDPTLYNGLLGTAFLCFRSYEITGDRHDLQLADGIIDTCVSAARASAR